MQFPCLFAVITLILLVPFCGFCFDYALDCCVNKDIPWYGDYIIGTVTGPLTITAALICWTLNLCDVETPFFGAQDADV